MTRITLNEINDTMEEIPSKLLLVINAIDKGNAETHQLLRKLIEGVQTSNRNQNHVVEQVLQNISNNSAGISTVIQEGFQGVENHNIKKGKIDTNTNKIKQHVSTLWKITLHSRKQAFFNITKLKVLQRYSQNWNKTLDIVADYLNNQNFDNAATKNKSNISRNESEAIKLLKENDSIVTKEADKGGAAEVMNKTHYYNMAVKILQDEET